MILKVIDPEKLTVTDLIPAVAMTTTLQELKKRGYRFVRGDDDLDDYDIAAFWMKGPGLRAPFPEEGSVFAIQAYDHEPGGGTTLLLQQRHVATHQDLVNMLTNIAPMLGVPPNAFRWRVDGEDASLELDSVREITAARTPL